jgi:hypothetical protein
MQILQVLQMESSSGGDLSMAGYQLEGRNTEWKLRGRLKHLHAL